MAYSNIELHSGYPPLAPLRSVVEKVHIGVLVGFFNKEGFSDVPVHCESNPLPHRLGCKLGLTVGMVEGVVLKLLAPQTVLHLKSDGICLPKWLISKMK